MLPRLTGEVPEHRLDRACLLGSARVERVPQLHRFGGLDEEGRTGSRFPVNDAAHPLAIVAPHRDHVAIAAERHLRIVLRPTVPEDRPQQPDQPRSGVPQAAPGPGQVGGCLVAEGAVRLDGAVDGSGEGPGGRVHGEARHPRSVVAQVAERRRHRGGRDERPGEGQQALRVEHAALGPQGLQHSRQLGDGLRRELIAAHQHARQLRGGGELLDDPLGIIGGATRPHRSGAQIGYRAPGHQLQYPAVLQLVERPARRHGYRKRRRGADDLGHRHPLVVSRTISPAPNPCAPIHRHPDAPVALSGRCRSPKPTTAGTATAKGPTKEGLPPASRPALLATRRAQFPFATFARLFVVAVLSEIGQDPGLFALLLEPPEGPLEVALFPDENLGHGGACTWCAEGCAGS